MEAVATPARRTDFVLLAVPIVVCLVLPGPGVLLAALIVAATLALRRDIRSAALQLWWHGPVSSIALGIAAGAAIVILDSFVIDPVVQRLVHTSADVGAFSAVQGNVAAYVRLLLIAMLVGGVAEELVFRGFLIGWGSRLFGRRALLPAAVISSALFGFSHLYQGLAGVVETGTVGLLLAALYIGGGCKLLPCSFAHITVDAFGITELYSNGAISHFFAHLL
jgi:membrane protease YdiL (CAAX protease family)